MDQSIGCDVPSLEREKETKTMTTEEMVARMLRENTGRHFLDSGGDSGRHWQRNQNVDFEKRPEARVEFSTWGVKGDKPKADILVTVDVYHWLNHALTYDKDADARFQRWASLFKENREEGWLQLMEKYAEQMVNKYGGGHGIYAEGTEPWCANSYNDENLLSQDVQLCAFTVDGPGGKEEYVLLQIHGGADVRGGYTRPRVFTPNDELSYLEWNRAALYCSDANECGANWSRDGSSWIESGAVGGGYIALEDFDVVKVEAISGLVTCRRDEAPHAKHQHDMNSPLCAFAEEITPDVAMRMAWKERTLVICEGSALCPRCGEGTLEAGMY